ncbi:alpha/beta hydrolase, partial [Sorangium cellulosum]
QAAPAAAGWCAPELASLPGEVCAFLPAKEAPGPRVLMIFLHGVVQPDSGWQWAQQRGAARAGARHGVVVMMPRGRRGIGPRTMEDWWCWPTATAAQASHEDALLAAWDAARAELERRAGGRFERVLVFGFSNGAYYATSLAMRGRLPVDGYAAFAGGSGARYLERAGAQTRARVPLFVGWGGKDPAHRDQVALARMLRRLKWPSKALGKPRAGHAMTDDQVDKAFEFLIGKRGGAKKPGRGLAARPR